MSVHVYPRSALLGDGLAAGCGLALTGGPLLLLDTAPVVTVFLLVLLVAFAVFGLRSARMGLARIHVNEDHIAASAFGVKALAWNELNAVKLSYYSTKRDRDGGWLQLVLAGGRRRLAVDSRLEGFRELAVRAARAARANGLTLDSVTVENFRALGVDPESDP